MTSVEFVVAFARAVPVVLGLAAVAIAVMVVVDAVAVWPRRRRPAHRAVRSPGRQLWTRSVETDTAQLVITPEGWSR